MTIEFSMQIAARMVTGGYVRSRAAPGRPWLAAAICAVFCLGVGGCGDTGSSNSGNTTRRSSRVAPQASEAARTAVRGAPSALEGDVDDDESPATLTPGDNSKDNDADYDNDEIAPDKSYIDGDDGSVVGYGHAAAPADREAVARLVERYYMAASAGDGSRACAAIYPKLAESVPQSLGQAPGPVYARGKTCAVVMSKLFEHSHSQLAGPVRVTGVRLNSNEGRALIGSASRPVSAIAVRKERGAWKIGELFSETLP
jgi:hypothetical protein